MTMNILILCTGNSARSILGEAILNIEGKGRIRAYSAGSTPKDTPHPAALALLKDKGIDTGFARSKSWEEFAAPDAPKMDVIITVCNNAAGETCPIWPGHPLTAHWGIEDPAAVTSSPEETRAAFEAAFGHLLARVTAFLALPGDLPAPELRHRLNTIGQMEGATS